MISKKESQALIESLTEEQQAQLIELLMQEAQKKDANALAPLLKDVASEIEVTSTIWKNGVEPMPFWDFCYALDENYPFPLQFKPFEDTGLHRASGIFAPDRQVTELVLMYGKGTNHASTLFTDALSGETLTIREWCESGKDLHVTALTKSGTETIKASSVYYKGEALTYKVVLADSRSVSVSPNHRFLTSSGWVMMKDLVVGYSNVLCVPVEHAESCDLEQPLSQGSQGGYPSCSRLCGECVHSCQESCLSGVPSLRDELPCHPCHRADDSDTSCKCVPVGLSLHDLSKNCADAHRPPAYGENGELIHSGLSISPQVRKVIDLYCNLPSQDKEFLSSVYFSLISSVDENEFQSLHLSFCQQLSSCLNEVFPQYQKLCSLDCTDPEYLQFLDHFGACESLSQFHSLSRFSKLHADKLNTCLQSRLPCENQHTFEQHLDQEYQFSSLDTSNYCFVKVVSIVPHEWAKIYDMEVPVAHNYFDANGICSHNSGKDWLAGKYIAYLTYCMLNMAKEPAVILGLGKGSHMAILNVAPSEDMAKTVFFEPYLKRFIETDIFKPYIINPKDQILSDRIVFPQINLTLYSKHSKSSGVDGYNTLAWVLDEADDFVDRSTGKSLAEDIHKVLRSSCATRMKGRWLGIVISYPRREDGFMTKTYDWALKSPRCYASRAASWDVNLKISRDDPDIMDDYASDPADARARYECLPMATDAAFFDMPEKIAEAVDHDRKPIVEVVTEEFVRVITDHSGSPVEKFYIGATTVDVPSPVPGYEYFLSVDGGLTGDSYAIAVFHADKIDDAVGYFCPRCGSSDELKAGATYNRILPDNLESYKPSLIGEQIFCGYCYETPASYNPVTGIIGWWKRAGGEGKQIEINGKKINLPHVYEDLLVEIKPFKATRVSEKNKPVDYLAVQKLCEDLIVGLRIGSSRFDPWNSASIVQGLQSSTGTDVQTISYTQPEQYKRARLVKSMLHANMITLIPNDKRDREWRQLSRNGMKIDHPKTSSGSKDLFDAEAAAIWLAATSQCKTLEFS